MGGFDFFDTGTGLRVGCVEKITCTQSPGSTIPTQGRCGRGDVSKKWKAPVFLRLAAGKVALPDRRVSSRTAPGHVRAHQAMLDALNPLRGETPGAQTGWQAGGFDFFDTGAGLRVGCVEKITCTQSPGSTIPTQGRCGRGDVSKKSKRPHHPENTAGKTDAPDRRLSG